MKTFEIMQFNIIDCFLNGESYDSSYEKCSRNKAIQIAKESLIKEYERAKEKGWNWFKDCCPVRIVYDSLNRSRFYTEIKMLELNNFKIERKRIIW